MMKSENLKKDEWFFVSLTSDLEKFYINKIDIWSNEWIHTGEFVMVKDPSYGNEYKAEVLNVESNSNKIEFLAIEFSNCVWGIYLKDKSYFSL